VCFNLKMCGHELIAVPYNSPYIINTCISIIFT
jgi:hypothetical protein